MFKLLQSVFEEDYPNEGQQQPNVNGLRAQLAAGVNKQRILQRNPVVVDLENEVG